MDRGKQAGTALLFALIAFIILAGMGAAFVSIALAQGRMTTRAASSEGALHIAEGGLDDAINRMNAFANASTVPPEADFAVIGRTVTLPDGSVGTQVTGSINRGTYTVTISPAYTTPQTYKLTSAATLGSENRAIEAYVSPASDGSRWDYGLFGDVVLDSGGTLTCDSYKSSLGAYETQVSSHAHGGGSYLYARPHGHVGSNGDVQVRGGSRIFGNASPGPEGILLQDGGQTFVLGSTAPMSSRKLLPPVQYAPPDAGVQAWPTGTAIEAGDLGSRAYTLTGGVYRASSVFLRPIDTVRVTEPTVLYVDGDVDVKGAFIIDGVANPQASITIYQKTGSFHVNAQSIVNGASSNAASFQVFSASTGTVRINGGAGVYAAVYAPEATYVNNGDAAVHGAVVAKSIQVTGSAVFHYDEDLSALTQTEIRYRLKSWKEYVP